MKKTLSLFCYEKLLIRKRYVLKQITSKTLLIVLAMTLSGHTLAKRYKYPNIYPFVPVDQSKIYGDVERVTEDKEFIKNFFDIIDQKLSKAKTTTKPWTSTYWPLSKGTIADPYEKSAVSYYLDTDWYDWKKNYKKFQYRKKGKLLKTDLMTEAQLARLAPSEKYDLLLGDIGYDLSDRLWEYMKGWGSKKENAFLKRLSDSQVALYTYTDYINPDTNAHVTALSLAQKFVTWEWFKTVKEAFEKSYQLQGGVDVENALTMVEAGIYNSVEEAYPEALQMAKDNIDNYVLVKKNSRIAAWEGICNGWSTAAGIVPRPRKAVSFKLPNGKNLKFYPEDIKGLVALYWVNSMIQDNLKVDENGTYKEGGTLSAGMRCNLESAKKDYWGRKYDHKADPFNKDHSPRCVGVHPATWHMGLVNLIGKQGRSFVVERKVGPAVDNHPMYKYQMKYFNPNSGRTRKKLKDNIEKISRKDQFKKFRNENSKYIVGVQTTMTYLDYARPGRATTNSEKDDEEINKRMYYDLELDADYNIVGGQWRAVKVGTPQQRPDSKMKPRVNYNQPDFFWTVTKRASWDDVNDETGMFKSEKDLSAWTDKTLAPPSSWKTTAKSFHSFNYDQTFFLLTGKKCNVRDLTTNKIRKVSCEYSTNRPQPLINVLKTLIERSK
jgi:hypothetical protein